jgi:hypothetical protein
MAVLDGGERLTELSADAGGGFQAVCADLEFGAVAAGPGKARQATL